MISREKKLVRFGCTISTTATISKCLLEDDENTLRTDSTLMIRTFVYISAIHSKCCSQVHPPQVHVCYPKLLGKKFWGTPGLNVRGAFAAELGCH